MLNITEPPAAGRTGASSSLLPDPSARQRLRRLRTLKDKCSRWGITGAGFGVVFALTLIFVYLFYEVLPVFRSASIDPQAQYSLPLTEGTTSEFLLERYETLGIQYTEQGSAVFFEADNGNIRERFEIPVPEDTAISSFATSEVVSNAVIYGLDDGQAIIAGHAYDFSYPDDQRRIDPRMEYPFGESPFTVDEDGAALTHVAMQASARGMDRTVVAAVTEDQRLLLTTLTSRSNLLTGEVTVESDTHPIRFPDGEPMKMLVDKSLRNLFVLDTEGRIHYYDIENPAQSRLVQTVDVGDGDRVTAMDFMTGTVSLVMGTETGELSQWFLVRDEDNRYSLERVRDFTSHDAPITAITPEYRRKGFLAVDEAGQLGIHYGTSARTLYLETVSERPLRNVAVSPVNGRILLLDNQDRVQAAGLWNEHPQISFSALWNRVWYEGRSDPEYIWQSSSGSDEFESKFSLVPLSVGTLKAAFYAMLFAMPLAIAGAIYTAYFMTPKLRGVVKPTIEIMEALPTVILGFLAGLWLAPFAERNLPAIFSFLLFMPLLMLLFGWGWSRLPLWIRGRVPEGWEAALLVPVILLFGYVAVVASPWLEVWLFGGSMRQWFTEIGITYDQRNALIVGIAMGFAVIPTIFSIAEDAVFTVPRHLTQGSLALGATRWQTVKGVVLPTASPGIFSGVMMGFGRAVGETMIVLMATGNSPVVNFNIFEGMRTLSANIAVELPETAVGSSHFRVLFLAALVLLTLTFVVNTLAEIIRQRLRQRYSNL